MFKKNTKPPLLVLINDFKELKNFTKVSEKYHVTSNAVRKWCIFYGLPIHTKELLAYIFNPNYVYSKESIYKGGERDIDYEKILKLYNDGMLIKDIAKEVGHSPDTISLYLKKQNIDTQRNKIKAVDQYDLNDNFIQSFNSAANAARYIYNLKLAKSTSCIRHIKECCKEKIKKAYGFKWKFKNKDI